GKAYLRPSLSRNNASEGVYGLSRARPLECSTQHLTPAAAIRGKNIDAKKPAQGKANSATMTLNRNLSYWPKAVRTSVDAESVFNASRCVRPPRSFEISPIAAL